MNYKIPLPIQVVIDDVGWWNGKNDSLNNGPYRGSFVRNHVPEDYQAIVTLGRKLNIRPQAAMIMGEWDRLNRVAALPSASKFGTAWDNSRWVGPWLEEVSEIIRANPEYFEITLHGIGHEYWENGIFTRGEWYDKKGTLRAEADVKTRLSLFAQILEDSNLGPFPESFVPPAFVHVFSPEGKSLIPLLKESGIKYISTPFLSMLNNSQVQGHFFGADQGIITVDRGKDICNWATFGKKPEGEIKGPICGMHWINILHKEPEKNEEIVDYWVDFLKPYESSFDTMLAGTTKQMTTQLVYHEFTQVQNIADGVAFDFTKVHDIPILHLDSCFILKLEGPSNLIIQGKGIEIISHSYKPGPDYHELLLKPVAERGNVTWVTT